MRRGQEIKKEWWVIQSGAEEEGGVEKAREVYGRVREEKEGWRGKERYWIGWRKGREVFKGVQKSKGCTERLGRGREGKREFYNFYIPSTSTFHFLPSISTHFSNKMLKNDPKNILFDPTFQSSY